MRSVSPAGRLFFAERVRGQVLLVHCVKLFLTPRAWSSRSGCASSAALRPACACDPSAPPAVWTLGVGVRQPRRIPTTASASGTRTLQRDGSCRLRGRLHRRPPVRYGPARTVSPHRQGGCPGLSPHTLGGGLSIRPVGASGHVSGGCGSPSGRPAVGYRWRGFMRTARGPGAGRPCSVAAEEVSACSERGRANAERLRTRRAKKNPARRAVDNPRGAPAQQSCHAKELAAHPRGGLKTRTRHMCCFGPGGARARAKQASARARRAEGQRE
jgi:hypothetical protein